MLQPEAQRRVVPEAVELVSSRSRREPFGAVIEIIEAEDVAKRKDVDCTGGGASTPETEGVSTATNQDSPENT